MFSCFQELDLKCDTGNAQMVSLLCGALQNNELHEEVQRFGEKVKHSTKAVMEALLLIDCVLSSIAKPLSLGQLLFFKVSGVTWL